MKKQTYSLINLYNKAVEILEKSNKKTAIKDLDISISINHLEKNDSSIETFLWYTISVSDCITVGRTNPVVALYAFEQRISECLKCESTDCILKL